jgi:hypothetical protein
MAQYQYNVFTETQAALPGFAARYRVRVLTGSGRLVGTFEGVTQGTALMQAIAAIYADADEQFLLSGKGEAGKVLIEKEIG